MALIGEICPLETKLPQKRGKIELLNYTLRNWMNLLFLVKSTAIKRNKKLINRKKREKWMNNYVTSNTSLWLHDNLQNAFFFFFSVKTSETLCFKLSLKLLPYDNKECLIIFYLSPMEENVSSKSLYYVNGLPRAVSSKDSDIIYSTSKYVNGLLKMAPGFSADFRRKNNTHQQNNLKSS